MDSARARDALGALSHGTRLNAFRLLVRSEPAGLAAGEIARQLNVPSNTLSNHLAILSRAALLSSERKSRSLIYRADIPALGALMVFLAKDCCGGRDELCGPLIQELACC